MFLVTPKQMGCEWTADNKIFRSSLWNDAGELVSASFPKFWNMGEKPELSPVPNSLKGWELREKLDGSLLTVTKYKGNFIIRTRGTTDAEYSQANGEEIQLLRDKYPRLFGYLPDDETWDFSFILEWVTSSNVIVLRYPEIDFFLIGLIYHSDYSLETQDLLDTLAVAMNMKRPEKYELTDDLSDLTGIVQGWIGKEGIVMYSPNGQQLIKLKSTDYLAKHRMKSELESFDKVVDVYFNYYEGNGVLMDYSSFMEYLTNTFDYEVALMARSHVSNICDGMKEVMKIESGMKEFAAKLSGLTRKVQAEKVFQAYGQTNRASFVFKLLDGKPWDADTYKKLTYQVTKN